MRKLSEGGHWTASVVLGPRHVKLSRSPLWEIAIDVPQERFWTARRSADVRPDYFCIADDPGIDGDKCVYQD